MPDTYSTLIRSIHGPKIIAVFVAILIFGPWMLRIMVEYVSGMFINLPMYIG